MGKYKFPKSTFYYRRRLTLAYEKYKLKLSTVYILNTHDKEEQKSFIHDTYSLFVDKKDKTDVHLYKRYITSTIKNLSKLFDFSSYTIRNFPRLMIAKPLLGQNKVICQIPDDTSIDYYIKMRGHLGEVNSLLFLPKEISHGLDYETCRFLLEMGNLDYKFLDEYPSNSDLIFHAVSDQAAILTFESLLNLKIVTPIGVYNKDLSAKSILDKKISNLANGDIGKMIGISKNFKNEKKYTEKMLNSLSEKIFSDRFSER